MTQVSVSTRTLSNNGKNGKSTLSGLALTRQTSLSLKTGLALDDWLRVGLHIARISDSSTWWLADWLIYGRERYPDRYKQAVEDTTLEYQTLRNYAWVAGRISVQRRRANLSFQHHAEVAALSHADQDTWLERAERFGWTRNRLRTEIKLVAQLDEVEAAEALGAPAQKVLNLRTDDEQVKLWEEAAGRTQQNLRAWIVDVLNMAALAVREAPIEEAAHS